MSAESEVIIKNFRNFYCCLFNMLRPRTKCWTNKWMGMVARSFTFNTRQFMEPY